MAAINPLTREVVFKIVFYGPGLGGKTTSLQHIHDASSPDHRGKMVSLATSVDRTLYFDFLPLRLPTVRGMGVRLQLFTVPGQVHYAATRKLVVTGADGVVFVADSQESRTEANADSVDDLRQNLAEQQRDPSAVPLVFQFNKRDLPGIVPMEELAEALAVGSAPVVGSVATTGQGVFETLELVTRAVIRNFERGLPANQSTDAAMLSEERGIEHALRQVRLDGGTSGNASAATAADIVAVAVPAALESGASGPDASDNLPVRPSADIDTASVERTMSDEPSSPAAPAPPPARAPLQSASNGSVPVASASSSVVPAVRPPSPSVSVHEGSRGEGSSPGIGTGGDPRGSQVGSPPSGRVGASSPSPSPPSRRRPSAPSLGTAAQGSTQQETSWPAPVSETPTITPVPAMGFSLAELWPEGERELVREAEAAIAIRDLERAVELLDRVATRALANTVAMLGSTDAPRDPLLALGLLGVDGRRYLAFRALVRDVRAGAKASDRLTLGAYAFLLEVRSARSRIGL